MRRSLGWLIGSTFAVWVLATAIGWSWKGPNSLAFSSACAVLCLAPAIGTLTWAWSVRDRTPEERLVAVLGGTIVRLLIVVGGGVALYMAVPMFRADKDAFLTWGLIFYLTTLVAETVLLTFGLTPTDSQPSGSNGQARSHTT